MLHDWHKQREEETRRKAEWRGRILVRRILAPIALAVVSLVQSYLSKQ